MLDTLTLSGSQRTTLQLATESYARNVYEAADFLSARGISEAMASSYRLGVCSDPLPGHERFVGMLSLPYLTPAGTVSMKFRALDPERKPKYDQPEGQVIRMYNVAALHSKGDTVAICEGEFDALACTELVGIPAVGIPGATQWDSHPHWPRCFADYETVLVVADNDLREDGKNPGLKAAKNIARSLPQARVVVPPPGLDLSDWIVESGAAAVREACGVNV